MKCLINEQQCFFSGVKSPAEAKASDFRLNKKNSASSLLNDFKDILGKARVNGLDNNDAFVNVGNKHT